MVNKSLDITYLSVIKENNRKFATVVKDTMQSFEMKLNEVQTEKAIVTISLRNLGMCINFRKCKKLGYHQNCILLKQHKLPPLIYSER